MKKNLWSLVILLAMASPNLTQEAFKFDLDQKFYLLTNLDYLGSNPEFSNIEITTSIGSRRKSTASQFLEFGV